MAFEKLMMDISMLLTEMQNEPADAHELSLALKEKLSELKAFGMPLPDDLVRLEKELDQAFTQPDAEPSEG